MKKKLALVLAAIMTVAAVPSVAFASTKITVVDEISTAVDSNFTSRVELKKGNDQVDVGTGSTFDVNLKLTNGKFAKDDNDDYIMEADGYKLGTGIEKISIKNDTTATVTLNSDIFNQSKEGLSAEACVLAIAATANEVGDVVATFTSNVSAFKTAKEVIATAYGDKIKVESEGTKVFVEDADNKAVIKDITINELVSGLLKGNDITLKLKGNYEFVTSTAPKVSFLNQNIDADVNVTANEIKISFKGDFVKDNMRKDMTISGIELKTKKGCKAGDVASITVSSKDFTSTKLEVAKMVKEAVTYSVEDKDLPVIYAGAKNDDYNTLKVSVEENTGDILNTSRKATFTFPEGIEVVDIDSINGVKVSGVKNDFRYEIDENVVSIWNYSKGSESDKTDLEIQFVINAAPTFSGDVNVKLGGQFDDKTLKVATVKAPYTIEAKTKDVLIDYRYVPVNDIVIKEAEEGILKKNDSILLAVEKMDFEDNGKVEVTEGDIDVDVDINKTRDTSYLELKVNGDSSEASTVVISGLELYLDRTLPVGGYALTNVADTNKKDSKPINILWENSASAKANYDESGLFKYKEITVNKDYVNVITSGRDQDDSMTKRKIIITVGASTMTAGTDTIKLDAPAYINNENYTMLPVRAIAEAFGATVNWDDATKTVTVLSGQRIISMTIGSKTMYINGTPVSMNTSAAITNERTFLPVRDLANAIGISAVNWTEASGTVTLN